MKKEKMIKTIQCKEAYLFLLVKQAELVFGENSEPHKRARSAWNSVMTLMNDLSIESDLTLPNYLEAYNVMSGAINKKDIVIQI